MKSRGFTYVDLIIVVAVALIIASIAIHGLDKQSKPERAATVKQEFEKKPDRFKLLYVEKHPEEGTYVSTFEVWEDTAHHQEIVCTYGGPKACYVTGFSTEKK